VCAREYTSEYLAVSHRWEDLRAPDPRGEQLRELKEHLQKHPMIKYVFLDAMCMPLPPHRAPTERSELTLMLPNVALLYLGCSVLVLLDQAFTQRFWLGFELWCSLQTATASGLVATSEIQRRCRVVPLEGVAHTFADEVKEEWRKRSSDAAYYKLSQPELLVSNASDREVVLAKLLQLAELVQSGATGEGAAPTPPPVGTPPASSQGSRRRAGRRA